MIVMGVSNKIEDSIIEWDQLYMVLKFTLNMWLLIMMGKVI